MTARVLGTLFLIQTFEVVKEQGAIVLEVAKRTNMDIW